MTDWGPQARLTQLAPPAQLERRLAALPGALGAAGGASCARPAGDLPGTLAETLEEIVDFQVLIAVRHLFFLLWHFQRPRAGLAIQRGLGGAVGIREHGAALGQPRRARRPARRLVGLRGGGGGTGGWAVDMQLAEPRCCCWGAGHQQHCQQEQQRGGTRASSRHPPMARALPRTQAPCSPAQAPPVPRRRRLPAPAPPRRCQGPRGLLQCRPQMSFQRPPAHQSYLRRRRRRRLRRRAAGRGAAQSPAGAPGRAGAGRA